MGKHPRDEYKRPVQAHLERLLKKARKIVQEAKLKTFECPSCESISKIVLEDSHFNLRTKSPAIEVKCTICGARALVDVIEAWKVNDYYDAFVDDINKRRKHIRE
ncbi:hypothetical protein HXY33_01680 [Candidatus Bathyarchaeota archaeon]|nr:hypothetical protein [Candidatus Bathyarchaeota archaeon]